MKSRTLTLIAALTFLAALAISLPLTAQDKQNHNQHHHYKLIDLGTFGGPISVVNVEPTEKFINSAGTIVGGADTSFPTPEPACYNPVLNPDCFIFHAFVWKGEDLKDLGTLRGGEFSWAEGINSRGNIVGVSENGENDPMTGNPEFHAVLWQNDHILDLGTLGGNSSFAGSINDRGQIMGVSLNDVPDPFSIVGLGSTAALTQTRSFLWEHGKMHDLGTLGGPDSFAIFLNDAGEVAGVSYTSNDADPNTGFPHMDPFLWRDGKMQDLGNFGGTNDPFGPSLFVAGLNNRGEVVGSLNLPGDQIAHAFLWDGEKLIDLNASRGGLGGNFSFAAGLNDAGAVIGAATLPGDQVQHAFRWKNGVMTDLGTPAGDVCSQGENINSIGQIVGASQSAQDCFGRFTHAFLWENGGPSVDLNTLIPPDSSLQLTVAALITDRGEIIGGGDPLGCTNNDACNHVYVLIPCDENHPAVEGCNYSLVDATTANDVRPTQAIQASALTSTATTAALTITSGAPPVGTVGVSYGGVHTVILDRPYPALFWFTGWELTAAGGAGSYHWSWSAVPGSTLPPGLTVKVDEAFSGGSTRCCEKAFIPVIGGTPTVPGIYHVIVAVTDSSATPKHASATYTITILR